MVWMITLIGECGRIFDCSCNLACNILVLCGRPKFLSFSGYTLYIPDTVMGLTFVAAGVSVPDALSSVAVIKEG